MEGRSIFIFLIVLIVWGIIGAIVSSSPGVDCKLPVGPLCFFWHKNVIGQIAEFFQDASKSSPGVSLGVQKKEVPKELCDQIVPEYVSLREPGNTTQVRAIWGAGLKASRLADWCHRGEKVGENQNYFYCDISLTKQIHKVDAQGVILEDATEYYTVNLVVYDNGSDSAWPRDFKVFNYSCTQEV